MKADRNCASAAVLFGLSLAVLSGAAQAGSIPALQHAALRKACTEQGGRFERLWRYNDQGVRWGEVLSCSTSAGYITCQDTVCRGGRWILPDGVTATDGGPEKNNHTVQFPAEPAAFSAALAALAGN